MNLGAERWISDRHKDAQVHREDYRPHALRQLRLKTVLKVP